MLHFVINILSSLPSSVLSSPLHSKVLELLFELNSTLHAFPPLLHVDREELDDQTSLVGLDATAAKYMGVGRVVGRGHSDVVVWRVVFVALLLGMHVLEQAM